MQPQIRSSATLNISLVLASIAAGCAGPGYSPGAVRAEECRAGEQWICRSDQATRMKRRPLMCYCGMVQDLPGVIRTKKSPVTK